MRKVVFRENGISNTSDTPIGYKFLGYVGESLSEKRGATISVVGGGGGGNLSSTLLSGNLSGTSSIFMQGTDLININTTATASAGVIFSESNNYVYLSSDGYWSDDNNSGVFADNSGYFALFGGDWTTSFEGDGTYAGFYAGTSIWSVYIGAGVKGVNDSFRVKNNLSSGNVISAVDPIWDNGGGGIEHYGSDSSPRGILFLYSGSCYSVENGASGTGGDPLQYVRASFLSSENSTFGYNGQSATGATATTAQYCSMINSNGSIIRGRNTITSDSEIKFSTILASDNGYIESSRYTSIISCGGTVHSPVSAIEQDYVAVIGHSVLSLTASSVLDYSTIVDNLYVDEKTFFRSGGTSSGFANIPIGATGPTAPIDGDIWAKDDGGVTTLNLRVGGVTKSVTLT